MTDKLLKVESVLSEQEKEQIIDLFCKHNPGMKGIKVADALEVLHSSDAHLDYIEPIYSDLKDKLNDETRGYLGVCILASIYIMGKGCKVDEVKLLALNIMRRIGLDTAALMW